MFPSTAWRHPCRCDCIDVGSTLTVIRDEERARNSKQSILYYLSHKPQRSTFEMNYWWILYSYWVQQRWMHAYSIRCFPFPHHIRTCHIQHTIIFWDLFFFFVYDLRSFVLDIFALPLLFSMQLEHQTITIKSKRSATEKKNSNNNRMLRYWCDTFINDTDRSFAVIPYRKHVWCVCVCELWHKQKQDNAIFVFRRTEKKNCRRRIEWQQ